jgi:cytochrome c-type biogenesis protein CcmE
MTGATSQVQRKQPNHKNRNLKIFITVGIAVAGLVFIAYSSLKDVSYYEHVDKVVQEPEKWLTHPNIKVHGFVVPASIHKNDVSKGDNMISQEFELETNGERLDVRHRGAVPDTFKDQAETVVSGHLVKEGDKLVLLADDGENSIMAKCPSKYAGSSRQ